MALGQAFYSKPCDRESFSFFARKQGKTNVRISLVHLNTNIGEFWGKLLTKEMEKLQNCLFSSHTHFWNFSRTFHVGRGDQKQTTQEQVRPSFDSHPPRDFFADAKSCASNFCSSVSLASHSHSPETLRFARTPVF